MQKIKILLLFLGVTLTLSSFANESLKLRNTKIVTLDLPSGYTHINPNVVDNTEFFVKGKDLTSPTKIIVKAGKFDDEKVKRDSIELCDNSDHSCIEKFGQLKVKDIGNVTSSGIVAIDNTNWYKMEYENNEVIATFLLLLHKKNMIIIMFNTPKYTGKEAEMKTIHNEIAKDLDSAIKVDLSKKY